MQKVPNNPPANRLAAKLLDLVPNSGRFNPGVPGVTLIRADRETPLSSVVFKPSLYIVAQGGKEACLAKEVFHYDALHYLLLTVPLAIRGRISDASPEKPYLAIRIHLDLGTIAELAQQVDDNAMSEEENFRGLKVFQLDEDLLNVTERLLKALQNPNRAKVLAPMAIREALFYVLTIEAGAMLRDFVNQDRHNSQISQTINYIQQHFAQSISVGELAKMANMSESSFYAHFKNVTDSSPQQYLKSVRLHEARRLLLQEKKGISEAAFQVGYASPSQFSREFKRLFGVTPNKAFLPPGGYGDEELSA